MREKRIQVKPFEMLSILEYKGIQRLNDHGEVMVTGLIESEKKDDYLQKAMSQTWVQIVGYDDENKESTIFYGVLSDFRVAIEGDGCIVQLLLHSGTKLMDYEKHIRTFQKGNYTYPQIVSVCNEEYDNADTIFSCDNERVSLNFLMQYQETDWQFLRRLASIANTVILPDSRVKGEKYYFGVPDTGAMEELEAEGYTICQDYDVSVSGKKEMVKGYVVESRSLLALGNQVTFQGNKLRVWKIETVWKGNELYHKYYLKSRETLQVPRQYHPGITGLSLMGTVKAVAGEQVQIKITEDENPESGQCWFAFSTVYSSPDGAGWYCMPEINDTVRLYVPSADENQAYVTSAVHENNGKGIRTNPSHKIWRNKQGKEIRMTPEKILLTNNDGMSVELIDGQGIKINSNASITIKASDNISISSNASVEMAASNRIVLKQGDTTIELADGIKLSGAKINLQ